MEKKKNSWHIAQEHEQQWWMRGIHAIDFEYIPRFAGELLRTMEGIITITRQTRILEIGSGPAGILTNLPSDFRIGIDPLEHFFRKIEKCRQIRDKGVRYLSAQGEYLPFPDSGFNFVIMDNILDHCEDIELVMAEIHRVLEPGGILYLRNYTFTVWGFIVAELLDFFGIDRKHPYHLREKDLTALFHHCRLESIVVKRKGFFTFYKNLLTSGRITWILRALSLSWADKVLFVLRKRK